MNEKPRVIVFGVCNWDNKEHAESQKEHLTEWYNRVNHFIKPDKVFLAAGSYSNPEYNPLPELQLVQNYWRQLAPPSPATNYFRNGFMAGCWHALLNEYGNFDILLHLQCRQLIGEDMEKHCKDFMSKPDKFMMAPRWMDYDYNKWCEYVEVGCMAMKPIALSMYTALGLRPSIGLLTQDEYKYPQAEEEAAILFANHWYNQWPEIQTTRKISVRQVPRKNIELDMDEFLKLPTTAASKHATKEEIDEWKRTHPYN